MLLKERSPISLITTTTETHVENVNKQLTRLHFVMNMEGDEVL